MKKLLLVAAVSGLAWTSAEAADIAARPYTKAPAPPPAFSWTGAYFGLTARGAFDHGSRFETTDGLVDAFGVRNGFRPATAETRTDGYAFGAEIGYNYQFAPNLVVGIEADAAYTDRSARTSVDLAVTRTSVFTSKMDVFGTVRGRVGYAFDRLFLYGTGGLAYGHVSNETAFLTGGTLTYLGSRSGMQAGWTAGGGIEFAIGNGPGDPLLFGSRGASLKLEYLHYDLGHNSYSLPPLVVGLVGVYSERVKTTGDMVRLGINYSLDGPVVAKY